MEKIILCHYGCEQEAKFIITKKNINCCSKNHSSCPANRRKNSEGLKKEHAKNPKNYSNRKYFAQNVSMLQEKYPEWYNAKIEKQKKTRRERYEAGLTKTTKGYKHSEETIEKIRKTIVTQRQKKIRNTAWEIRYKRELSYLEKWFYDNVILKNGLEKKYDIINEYSEYPYFIDFAFINEKIAVELDGSQHYENINNMKDHKKDDFLNKKGWIIYRIPYFELKTKDVEKEFMEFLNSKEKKEKTLDFNLIKYKEYKKIQKIKVKKEKTHNHNEHDNIEKILNSNINFMKFGWVQKVSELINKKPQKINVWMKKYLPEFYEEKCFKRNK